MTEQSIEELFARLKNPASTHDAGYQPPTVSSPVFSPPARGTPPVHSSDILSPAMGTPAPDQRTNNLLNLLKFNGGGAPQAPMAASTSATSKASNVADLVNSLQRTASGSAALTPSTSSIERVTSPSSTAQKDYLLGLLNRPRDASGSSPAQSTLSRSEDPVEKLAQSFAETNMQAPQAKPGMFGHVNPFNQLHASSPLNRSPNPEAQAAAAKKIEILKHSRDDSASSARAVESPAPKPAAAVSSPPTADGNRQSVSEALGGVAEQVDKEVERALAQADAQQKTEPAVATKAVPTGHDAIDVGLVNNGNADQVESSWESAEDEEQELEQEEDVPVYNFPMKPFVCIHLQPVDPAKPIRQDNFMMVAQLKKEFDQVDRCLVSATQSYIGYAQLGTKKDNNGLRVIRQDTGDHKQVFRSSGERVFNIQFCSSKSDVETVLGTGVNGTIYWTSLAKSRGDLFVEDDVESHGFYMPPVATQEEQTSGSPVKTRAKLSSRHPEFLAVARGKHIYLIGSETAKRDEYCDPKTRCVNSEKFFDEHTLRISTAKACKDLAFSEDDSVIASLDKSGRVKFWDIRELSKRAMNYDELAHGPVELSEPIWSFSAVSSGSRPDDKPSVSSIMFLDKDKPTSKGNALRYLIIGFKQNHILQLYDMALRKPVQEVRLPHEQDSDGFCSITYHPRTGIIAVGHPTRNSIYFIHLSAPRYNVSTMDQAQFLTHLAKQDGGLPKVDSTAIMSGARELSFSKVGSLRSLDMLRDPVDEAESGAEGETLFELYVAHSKGVTCIPIKRKDLGWNKDSGMVRPIDAIEEGFATVRPLLEPTAPVVPTAQVSASETSTQQSSSPAKKAETSKPATPKPEAKKAPVPAPSSAAVSAPTSAPNGAAPKLVLEKSSKQAPEASLPSQTSAAAPRAMTSDSYASAAQRPNPSAAQAAAQAVSAAPQNGASAAPSATRSAPAIPVSDDVQTLLNKQFDSLYQRIDSDRRVQDASGAAKQDAMLRLVSSTLTENVEKSLNRIVSGSIEKEIIPAVNASAAKAVEKKLAESVPQQLNNVLSKEIKSALPAAIQQALKDPQLQRTITDNVATKVQQQVSALLQQSMPNLATQAAQKMVADLETRTDTQLREAEHRRQQDNAKILELSTLVRALSQTLQTMSDNQAAFQEQMVKMQQLSGVEKAAEEAAVVPATTVIATVEPPQPSPEEEEVKRITQMLVDGQYDSATLEWLQSSRQGDLFDTIFIRVNPQYLRHVTPLVALSVSAAITASFTSNIDARLDWLEAVLANIDLNDPDIRDVAPKIMDVLSQRLQAAYMQISEANPSENGGLLLRRISGVNRRVVEVRRLAG